jgi:hypothetical protein
VGRHSLVACILVAALVAAAAGCGGGGGSRLTAKEYKAKIAAIGKEANSAQSTIQSGISSNSTVKLATAMTAFAAAEEKMSKEVGDLNPPKDAEKANDQLSHGLHDISSAIQDVVPKVKAAASTSAAMALLNKSTDGVKAGNEVDQALSQLQKLGYAPGS